MGSIAFRIAAGALLLAVAMAGVVMSAPASGDNAQGPAQEAKAVSGPGLGAPPPNAVMLFNGKDLKNWHYRGGEPAEWWPVDNGVITVARGNIETDETFSDAFIHLEFRVPDMPTATGQAKGNSGIYVQGRYEIQVLDSYGINIPGKGDCGAIYGQHAPLVNACKPPLEWQTFDIIFRAPRLDAAGKVVEPGRMTVLQNNTVIQNNAELMGPNVAPVDENFGEPGPLVLQDHGAPLQYRNIWLVHLPLKGSDTYEPR